MSKRKSKAIPLATLVEGAGNMRNLDALMGEKNADPKLRKALVNAVAESRDDERQRAEKSDARAAPFCGGRPGGDDRDKERKRRIRIRQLGKKYPGLAAKDLYQHADARGLPAVLTLKRFATILSEEAPRRKRRN